MFTFKRLLFCCILFVSFTVTNAFAVEPQPDMDSFKTTEEILALYHKTTNTDCSDNIFKNALNENSGNISQDAPEYVARAWAKQVMQSPTVIEQILQCPEFQGVSDTKTITFSPLIYQFPNGRTLTINYKTQPKILKKRLEIANTRSTPDGKVSPELGNPEDPAVFINTEPSWYAIMVVQHDSLSEFVGPGKNNTLSLKYIYDNIDNIYPKGYFCTSKSAIAYDGDTINKAVRKTVNLEKDSNDYYVAGDIDLGWVMYAEIAADVIITVLTAGGGEAAMIAAKEANSARAAKNMTKTLKSMREIDKVKDYVDISRKISTHTDDIAKLTKNADDYVKALKKLDKARKAGQDTTEIAKEARNLLNASRKIDPKITSEILQNSSKLDDHIKPIRETIKELSKNADDLVKANKDVAKYKESAEAFKDLMKYRRELTAFRRPTTGNILTRSLKTILGSQKGADKIAKTSKLARAGMSSKSAKIGDWLFETTLKHGARLARFERDIGLLYGAIHFLGDMYDYTSNTSKEFSNGIEFMPLCLLSADDLEGQENVVNYGMWLLWQGNSTDSADDDAAYLQAMDFAAKFHYNLQKVQDEGDANCNVDIYVVRPLIRLDETNPNNPSGEMFYLFMTDIPWTTAERFEEKNPDINAWNEKQKELTIIDSVKKFFFKNKKSPEVSADTKTVKPME